MEQEIVQMMCEDKEQWAAIEGYEGYEVSTYGRVRSYWKTSSLGRGSGGYSQLCSQPTRFLTVRRNIVNFKNGDFINVVYLVAKTFLPNPNNYPKVLQYTKKSLHISNLCWYNPCEEKEGEIWKQYKDKEGYEVSNYGRVRSYWERQSVALGKKGFKNTVVKQPIPVKFLQFTRTELGYYTVRLGRKNYLFHRVLAELFIPNPHHLPNVDHIDRNPSNNRLDNLRWCNQHQNNLNSKLHSTNQYGMRGIRFRKDRQKWQCYWSENGSCKFSTYFNTKEEAIAFRQKMVEKHYNKDFYTES